MHQALGAFEEYLHQTPSTPPLVRLGLIHYQFEVIHPFLDGNGRIGRLLVTLLLCSWNLIPEPLLYLSAYLEAHRQDYYDRLLAVRREGAWQAWLLFFLHGVSLQARDVVARSRKLQDLRERYRTRFQAARAAARLLSTVDLLFARPILTVNQAAEALDVTFATAQRHINRLEAAGLLREITGQARNRVYRADEILAAIEEPLGPPDAG
jgi:Fic family protein